MEEKQLQTLKKGIAGLLGLLMALGSIVPGMTVSAAKEDPAEHLILRLDFEDAEAPGKDRTGSNDAQVNGEVTVSPEDPVSGNYAVFGGNGGNADAYLSLPVEAAALKCFTFSAWCRFDPEKVGTWARVFAVETDRDQLHLAVNDGNVASGYRAEIVRGGRKTTEFGTAGELPYNTYGEWHHVALTCDGKTLALYVNGTLIGSAPTDEDLSGWQIKRFYIGRTASYGDPSYRGDMDDIKVYDTALSPEQIAEENGFTVKKRLLTELKINGEALPEFSPYTASYFYVTEETGSVPTVEAAGIDGTDVTVVPAKSLPGKTEIRVKFPDGTKETVTVSFVTVGQILHHPEITDVKISDAFWDPLLERFEKVTAPYVLTNWAEKNLAGMCDFDRVAAGHRNTGDYKGTMTWGGSDFYASMAGACRLMMQKEDPELLALVNEYVGHIYAASESTEDGYLSIYNLLMTDGRPFCEAAEPNRSFDLFNLGYLLELSIPYYQLTGDARMLRVALRYLNFTADYSDHGKKNFVSAHCGAEYNIIEMIEFLTAHPELENDPYLKDVALRIEDYRELAYYLLWYHGRHEDPVRIGHRDYGSYSNDHTTYEALTEADGHAVIALLYFNALAEICRVNGDLSFTRAADRMWRDVTEKQMYVTGGTGSTYAYEGFAGDYYLPDVSYCESCTSGAMLQFSDSMSSLIRNGAYQDDVETQLYNTLLGSVGEDGTTFFYTNSLESHGTSRWEWHGCPCCTKYALMVYGNLPRYLYSLSDDEVWAEQYIGSEATLRMKGGDTVLTQEAEWSWKGTSRITVVSGASNMKKLHLRIPAWSGKTVVTVNGKEVRAETENGYLTLTGLKDGDRVEIRADVSAKRVYADENVTNDIGKAALRRGVFVYCFEGTDNKGGTQEADDTKYLLLSADAELKDVPMPELCGGVIALTAEGSLARSAEKTEPYTVTAIPFYARCNRGTTGYRVWIAEDPSVMSDYPAGADEEEIELRKAGITYTPMSNAQNPHGSGGSLSVIADGIRQFEDSAMQFDTFGAQLTGEEGADGYVWFGVGFDRAAEISRVIFWEGGHWNDGGWFGAEPTLELRIGGKWVPADAPISPEYPEDSFEAQQPTNEAYTFVLSVPTECDGVRIIGKTNRLAGHASCAEIEVFMENKTAPATDETAGPDETIPTETESEQSEESGTDSPKESGTGPEPAEKKNGVLPLAIGAGAVLAAVLAVILFGKKGKKKNG